MASPFTSTQEFCEVVDVFFAMLSDDAELGPRLRTAGVSQRFDFDDLGLVLNVRPAADGEPGALHWEWSSDVDWEPRLRMRMSSETANRYFQGMENVAMAIARRRIKAGGDLRAAFTLIALTKPFHDRYREVIASRYPHLTV
jgi:hypothetical protein